MIGIFFRNLFRDLVRQPMRTALTLSGVVWGTFSVVLLLAFGDSVSKAQIKRFHGMGQGIVLVFPSRTTVPSPTRWPASSSSAPSSSAAASSATAGTNSGTPSAASTPSSS